ncbi:MAG TPA: helix-turn-helix transcriptional regulator [Pilimelia sp.]|nr:helix-turn-helix transcriptional regulator [Pilimelia sp.]
MTAMHVHVSDALREGPFHHALRTAIKARGLSLERLRVRLIAAGIPIGVATLSSWQSGRRRPERPESLEAVTALEEILGLPAASLVGLLGSPRPRGPGARSTKAPVPFAEMVRLAGPVVTLMEELNWSADKVRVVSAWDSVEVGPDSRIESVETLVVVEALEEIDRYVTVYHGPVGIDLARTVSFACSPANRIGQVRQDPQHPLLVAEFLLGRTVPPGETGIVRFRVTDTGGSSDTEFGRFMRSPVQHVAVQVRFHPQARPRRCWRFVRDRQGWPDNAQKEIPLGEYGDVHVVRRAMAPGMVGIAWEY